MDIKEQLETYEKNLNAAKERISELEREKGIGVPSQMGESEERRLLRAFKVNSVEKLIGLNTADRAYAGVSICDKLAVIELKKDIDNARYFTQIFENGQFDRGELEKNNDIARVKSLNSRLAKDTDLALRLKAFGTGVSGGGAEWIETAISSSYIEEYLLEKQVANMFTEITMVTNPFKLPVSKNGTTARIVAEGVAASESNFNTSTLTFDANYKFVELYNLPEELNEDSAVAFLSLGRKEVIDSQIRALETAIINGDTTSTHQDSNVTAASDARKAWNGLRKLALANSANGVVVDFGAAVSATKLDDMLAAGGKFTMNPREAMFIVSPQIYHQMSMMDEVTTVDKFGPLATILTGILAAYRGRGIVASEFLFENMNASGVYDGTTTTKGGVLLVNKTRFMVGMRRPIKVRVAADARAEYDRYQLVSYQRADFQGHVQGATEKSVIYGVNATV